MDIFLVFMVFLQTIPLSPADVSRSSGFCVISVPVSRPYLLIFDLQLSFQVAYVSLQLPNLRVQSLYLPVPDGQLYGAKIMIYD